MSGVNHRRLSTRRLMAVARKELLHLRRDQRMLAVALVAPLLQLTVLGFAANLDVLDVPVVIVDQDRSPVSRAIAARVGAGEAFDVVGVTADTKAAEVALDRDEAEVVLVVPRGTARALARSEAVHIPLWINGTDTNRAGAARSYIESILRQVSDEHLPPVQADVQLPGLPEPRPRIFYNPTLQSRWFMVPAVLAMVLTVITVLLSSMAIVKERENGTIEQLSVTPIQPLELIVGKLLPFTFIGLVDLVGVGLLAVYGFGVPFRGDVLTLGALSVLYLLSTLGLGLLISTNSSSQQQAMMSGILVMLPSFLIGGVLYPVSNMPDWAQAIAGVIPLKYFIEAIRGIFLKGVGLEVLWWQASVLGLLGLLLSGVAVLRFRKRSS